MDKLYDLMLMGLKYQTLCSRKPSDILQVCLTFKGAVFSLLIFPLAFNGTDMFHCVIRLRVHPTASVWKSRALAPCVECERISAILTLERFSAWLVQVTLKHLGNVASMVNDPTVHARVASVTQQLMTCVDNFTSLHWIQLRQALLRFLKDKRVKVSLFLQEGIQLSSGKILLPLPLPSDPNAPQPGAIRAFDASVGPPSLPLEALVCLVA